MISTTIVMIVPIAVTVVLAVARDRLPKLTADSRGIALQTVIIMVVLLAIAGAVATVLLTRGGEAIEDIERQDIARDAADFTTKTLCDAAGFSWNPAAGGSCN